MDDPLRNPPTRLRWAIALAAAGAMAVSLFDRQVFGVLAPRFTSELHISNASYGWLGAAFSWAYLLGSPVAGRLVDRVGARRALLVSLVVWSGVAALHATASTFAALVVLRIALGLSESPSFPAAVQTVRRTLPDAQIARGVSFVFVGISIGSIAAVLFGTLLAARVGWRAAFVGTAAIALLWVPLWRRLTAGQAARDILDRKTSEFQVPFSEVLRNRHVLRALIAVAAAGPVGTFADVWEAKYFADHLHVSELARGGYLIVGPICYDVGALVFADTATRLKNRRTPFAIAALIAGTAIIALSLARTPLVAALCLALHSLGRGGLFSLLLAEMVACIPVRVVSTAAGIIAGARGLITAVVSTAIGHSLGHVGYPGVLLALGAWTLPGGLAWWLWCPRTDDAAIVRSRV